MDNLVYQILQIFNSPETSLHAIAFLTAFLALVAAILQFIQSFRGQSRPPPQSIATLIISICLKFFPEGMRAQFGDDIADVISEDCIDVYEKTGLFKSLVRFTISIVDLIVSGIKERKREILAKFKRRLPTQSSTELSFAGEEGPNSLGELSKDELLLRQAVFEIKKTTLNTKLQSSEPPDNLEVRVEQIEVVLRLLKGKLEDLEERDNDVEDLNQ